MLFGMFLLFTLFFSSPIQMALERLCKCVLETCRTQNQLNSGTTLSMSSRLCIAVWTHHARLFAFAHNLQPSNEWSFRIGARLTWINPTNSAYSVRLAIRSVAACCCLVGVENTCSRQSHVTINQNSNLNRVFCFLLRLELYNLWKILYTPLQTGGNGVCINAPPLAIIIIVIIQRV